MFKILTIGVLLFFLYRLILQPRIENQPKQPSNLNNKAGNDEDYIDYEEVE